MAPGAGHALLQHPGPPAKPCQPDGTGANAACGPCARCVGTLMPALPTRGAWHCSGRNSAAAHKCSHPSSCPLTPCASPCPAAGTCLPTPRYANAPAGACGLLGSPTPGGAVAAAAIAAANASTAVPSGGAAPTGAAGGCWGSMADMASGVPPLSGGFAPTPIRCTTAPGARAAALGGLPGGLLSPVPPLERCVGSLPA